jgi:ABC-type branched-subunit amino acid transport system substrate-binding protein
VQEVAIAGTVTAVRNGSDRLKLISWRISPDGLEIQRLSDSGHQAGGASNINISQFDANRFVTAVRAGNGKLKLIAFDVDGTGTIQRTGDRDDLAGEVREIALVTPASNNFTTAVRDGSGHLKLITWKMQD